MTYEIRQNAKYNSLEVYFDGKPSEAVRTALKEKKFRWHSVNKCWYGYGISEEALAAVITGTTTEEEPAAVVGDGYMGGGAIHGSKSNQQLYGSDLSAAIRADIKKAGIKGVTVSCKSYAGGQTITATIRVTPSEYITEQEFIDAYQIKGSQHWIYYGENCESIHRERFWSLDWEEQERIRIAAAAREYLLATTKEQNVRPEWVDYLTPTAKAKLERVAGIIAAYRYDCSNSMVDYFDTNFYYDTVLKPVAA